MKKLSGILIGSLLFSISLTAQVPEDAIRYSWYANNASARIMAVGGAMGSLGGDISATFINPAGLGLYRNREVVFSLSKDANEMNANYRDSLNSKTNKFLRFGPMGYLSSYGGKNKDESFVFSVAFNQMASFNEKTQYSGLNNYSSFSEQFAEEFAYSGYSINDVLSNNSPLPYSSAPALYTYLIDTATINGTTSVIGAPENILDNGQAIGQSFYKRTRGGLYELAGALACSAGKKWLWGATLGIPILSYSSITSVSEFDTSANLQNGFASFDYQDQFETIGTGLNFKLGAIYRPKEYIRIGFALHTPSYLTLTDTRNTSFTNRLESDTGTIETFTTDSRRFTSNIGIESDYNFRTPLKMMISGSYVFREVSNINKQRGFITADIEFVNHRGSRFSPTADMLDNGVAKDYFKSVNRVIKDLYKGAFNFRVGGELKYSLFMGRIGFAYYGNPYRDKALKANQMLLSGGLGYRNKGIFIDATYIYSVKKDAQFPYRLSDRANTFADLKNKKGIIALTIGVKI